MDETMPVITADASSAGCDPNIAATILYQGVDDVRTHSMQYGNSYAPKYME